MLRAAAKIIGMVIMIAGGSFALFVYQDRFSAAHQIERLQEEKQLLERVVQRLSDEKRVADVLVTDQKTVDGVIHTTLLFVEYARDGQPLPAKSFEIVGKQAHIDAMVIKFDRHFVSEGDPLRGHSIALFQRLYGDHESPADAARIDQPGVIPHVYRGADPRVTEFELDLWKNFWRLAEDPGYREEKGVRIANGQGVWGPFQPDQLYTITLESDGGLNIQSEPLRGIYREALKQRIGPAEATGG
jgi:hypothetical protein